MYKSVYQGTHIPFTHTGQHEACVTDRQADDGGKGFPCVS